MKSTRLVKIFVPKMINIAWYQFQLQLQLWYWLDSDEYKSQACAGVLLITVIVELFCRLEYLELE